MTEAYNPFSPPTAQGDISRDAMPWLSRGQRVRLAIYCLIVALLLEAAMLLVVGGVVGGFMAILKLESAMNAGVLLTFILIVATLIVSRITWHAYHVEVARLRKIYADTFEQSST